MNITLIGMAGVGKTSIGRALAKQLDFVFLDVDELIEKSTQVSLQRLIDTKGEQAFLKIEEQTILGLELKKETVISTGGSVVYLPLAMEYLKKHSRIVYLEASFKNIETWVSNRLARGLVGLKTKTLLEIYQERLPLYERYADYTVGLDAHYATDAIVNTIVQMLFGA